MSERATKISNLASRVRASQPKAIFGARGIPKKIDEEGIAYENAKDRYDEEDQSNDIA